MTTTAQPLQALKVANERRTAVATLKRDLFEMDRDRARQQVADAIREPGEQIGAMAVGDLLAAPRQCGPRGAHRLLIVAGVPPYRRLREMTDRQRQALVAALEAA